MMIADFGDIKKFNKWQVSTDAQGDLGNSSAKLEWIDANRVRFSGYVSTASRRKNLRSGFAGIWINDFYPPIDISMYDNFKIRVKTDGRIYVFNTRVRLSLNDMSDLYQLPFKTPVGQWADLMLPFKNFFFTGRGEVPGVREGLGLEPEQAQSIRNVGILMAEPHEGPFEMELESIRAVNRSFFEENRRYGTN